MKLLKWVVVVVVLGRKTRQTRSFSSVVKKNQVFGAEGVENVRPTSEPQNCIKLGVVPWPRQHPCTTCANDMSRMSNACLALYFSLYESTEFSLGACFNERKYPTPELLCLYIY